MPKMLLRRVALASLSVLLAAAAGASGPQAPGPRPLRAGAWVEFTWDAIDLPTVDEMELVLSLDGGRTYPLRVTGRLDPATRTIAWRVPALPASRARIALRVGAGEADEEESIVSVGDEFAIVAEDRAALEELFLVRGEWRTREAAPARGADCREPGLAGAPSEELRSAPAATPLVEPPRPLFAAKGALSIARRLERRRDPLRLRSEPGSARPLEIPLRA